MLGVTLSADEIGAAPPVVRRWVEQRIAHTFGWLPAPEPTEHTAAPLPADRDVAQARHQPGGSPRAADKALATQSGPADDNTGSEALRKLIAVKAYELWENQGRPRGRDLINWRQAEQEIKECLPPDTAHTNRAKGSTG